MAGNPAAELLQEIERRHTARIQWAVLGLFVLSGPAVVLPVVLGWGGALLALLFLGGCTLKALLVLEDAVGLAVGETAMLYMLTGRVVEFRVPDLHVVGVE